MAEQSAILARVLADVAKLSGLSVIQDAERQSWTALSNILAEAHREQQRAVNEAMAEAVADLARARKAWEKIYKHPYPASIEDWQRLATQAGLDANYVLQGGWKLADVMPIIEGYLRRQTKPAEDSEERFRHKPWPGSDDWHNWGIGRDDKGEWHLFHYRRSGDARAKYRWVHHPHGHVAITQGGMDALAQRLRDYGFLRRNRKVAVALSRLRRVIRKAVKDEGHKPKGNPIPFVRADQEYRPVIRFGTVTRADDGRYVFSPRD